MRFEITHTELSSELPVNGRTSPVIRPGNIAILPERNHGLDGERHAGLALADGFVLGIVGDIGRGVEDPVDAVADVCPNDAAPLGLCVLLYGIAKVPEERPRLDHLNGLLQALACRLGDAYRIRVRLGLVADVVGLVQVAMVTVMIEGYVQVYDVSVHERSFVGDTVADDFVDRGADGLGEEVVVQGRGVGLRFRQR